ncbi:DUF2510 domain-containing protein [Cellulomonas hominis]|uniref:DUF2510 domain-containing protein n=1 Tax=Cellulomonas hominis TaxID=156981 RepID=UPI001B8FAC35|nr:DUF2510 domain-containing protein [Cellulomonas hominis]VTR78058.1 hypothetical protein CHMI_02834 [Cellulomonas hominis]
MSGYGPAPLGGAESAAASGGAAVGPVAADAGWYPDPMGAGGQRWWDGRVWTEYTRPAGGYAPPVQPRNPMATAGLVLGIVSLVVNTLTITALVGIVLSGIGLARASTLQRYGYAPVGRAKAAWGLGLSVAGFFFTAFFKLFLF